MVLMYHLGVHIPYSLACTHHALVHVNQLGGLHSSCLSPFYIMPWSTYYNCEVCTHQLSHTKENVEMKNNLMHFSCFLLSNKLENLPVCWIVVKSMPKRRWTSIARSLQVNIEPNCQSTKEYSYSYGRASPLQLREGKPSPVTGGQTFPSYGRANLPQLRESKYYSTHLWFFQVYCYYAYCLVFQKGINK